MIFTNACLIAAAAVMMFPTTAVAQLEPGEAGTKITGGATLITNVEAELNRDLIQKQLETIMKNEECDSLASGKVYYDDQDYYKQAPFYKDNIGGELKLYTDYFGEADFINSYVNAAFAGEKVTFKRKNGADYSNLPGNTDGSGTCVGREEGVKKVLAYTLPYIDMNQYFEEAVELIRDKCILINDIVQGEPCTNAVNAWEKAMASYSGSLEGEYGKNLEESGSYGKWLQALAGKRCANFKTCGNEDVNDPTDKGLPARTSINIFGLFLQGRDAVINGRIGAVRRIISEINKEITVTRIQGVLRYTYRTGILKSTKDKEIGEGAAFAFGLLPQIWACNLKSAQLLALNTDAGGARTSRIGKNKVSFSQVRLALECNYKCLGIRFDDVGELNDCSDDDGNKDLCFSKKPDSTNICKNTKIEKANLKKCAKVAPPKNVNKKYKNTRFGVVSTKRYS